MPTKIAFSLSSRPVLTSGKLTPMLTSTESMWSIQPSNTTAITSATQEGTKWKSTLACLHYRAISSMDNFGCSCANINDHHSCSNYCFYLGNEPKRPLLLTTTLNQQLTTINRLFMNCNISSTALVIGWAQSISILFRSTSIGKHAAVWYIIKLTRKALL